MTSNQSEEADQLLKDPLIIEEAKQFGKYLTKNYSFIPVLQGLANEILCRREYPEFAQKQDKLKTRYLKGEINLQEVQNQLKKELGNLQLLNGNGEQKDIG